MANNKDTQFVKEIADMQEDFCFAANRMFM